MNGELWIKNKILQVAWYDGFHVGRAIHFHKFEICSVICKFAPTNLNALKPILLTDNLETL